MKKIFCLCFIVLLFVCLAASCTTVKQSAGLQEPDSDYNSQKNIENTVSGVDAAEKTVLDGNTDKANNTETKTTVPQEKNPQKEPAVSENVVDSAVYPKSLQDEPPLEVVIPANSEEETLPANHEDTKDDGDVSVLEAPLLGTETKTGETKKTVADEIKIPPAEPQKKDTAVNSVNDNVAVGQAEMQHNTVPESKTEADYKEKKSEEESAEEAEPIGKAPFIPDESTDSAQIFSEFPSTEPDDVKEAKASRNVRLYAGQKLEVVYPGEGWIYLGETTAQKGIKYRQRKLQDGLSVFHFDAEAPGNYILNFSYFDVFSDEFIADALSVKVESPKEKLTNTVRAPDYKAGRIEHEQNKDSKPDTAESSNSYIKNEAEYETDTYRKIQPESSTVNSAEDKNVFDSPELTTNVEKDASTQGQKASDLSPDEILKKAEQLIAEAASSEALSLLEDFLKNYTVRQDEGWFLCGQAYELNGKNKNIKQALKAYQTLIEAYPESKFWDKADARIRYIKKFYMNID